MLAEEVLAYIHFVFFLRCFWRSNLRTKADANACLYLFTQGLGAPSSRETSCAEIFFGASWKEKFLPTGARELQRIEAKNVGKELEKKEQPITWAVIHRPSLPGDTNSWPKVPIGSVPVPQDKPRSPWGVQNNPVVW